MSEVHVATTNRAKFEEIKVLLEAYGLSAIWLNVKGVEVQSDSLEEIALRCAEELAGRAQKPVLVEDAGLFIEALNGFPGPYSSYAYRTIGNAGILKLMLNVQNRRAEFKSAAAFSDGKGVSVTFVGSVVGRIAERSRGSHGFGFDPIFAPEGGGGLTFAEMTLDEKNAFSHRALSIKKFAEWFLRSIRRDAQRVRGARNQ